MNEGLRLYFVKDSKTLCIGSLTPQQITPVAIVRPQPSPVPKDPIKGKGRGRSGSALGKQQTPSKPLMKSPAGKLLSQPLVVDTTTAELSPPDMSDSDEDGMTSDSDEKQQRQPTKITTE